MLWNKLAAIQIFQPEILENLCICISNANRKTLRVLHFKLKSSGKTSFDLTTPLFAPKFSNKHSEQCISYRQQIIWNELQLDIREQTFNCFKRRIKWILSPWPNSGKYDNSMSLFWNVCFRFCKKITHLNIYILLNCYFVDFT